jgi:chromosome segregation ATPase
VFPVDEDIYVNKIKQAATMFSNHGNIDESDDDDGDEELIKALNDLHAQYDSALTEKVALVESLDSIEEDILEYNNQISMVNNAIIDLQDGITSLTNSIKGLDGEIAGLNGKIQQLQEKLQDLNDHKAELEHKVAELTATIALLENELIQIDIELSHLTADIAAGGELAQHTEASIEDKNREIVVVEYEITAQLRDIQWKAEEIKEAKAEVAEAEKEKKELSKELNSAHADLFKADAEINFCNGEINGNTNTISFLENLNRMDAAAIQTIEQSIQKMIQALGSMNDYSYTTGWWFWEKTHHVSRAAERQSQQQRIDFAKQQMQDLRSRITSREASITNHRKYISDYRGRLAAANALKSSANYRIQHYNGELTRNAAKITTAKGNVTNLQNASATMKEDLKSMERRKVILLSDEKTLQRKLQTYREKLTDLNAKKQDKAAKRDHLQNDKLKAEEALQGKLQEIAIKQTEINQANESKVAKEAEKASLQHSKRERELELHQRRIDLSAKQQTLASKEHEKIANKSKQQLQDTKIIALRNTISNLKSDLSSHYNKKASTQAIAKPLTKSIPKHAYAGAL